MHFPVAASFWVVRGASCGCLGVASLAGAYGILVPDVPGGCGILACVAVAVVVVGFLEHYTLEKGHVPRECYVGVTIKL